MNLKKIFSEITETLDKLDHDREEILRLSRLMVRNCSVAIKSIHRKDFANYQQLIAQVKDNHRRLQELVNSNLRVFGKYLGTPEQEFIEAVVLYALIQNEEIPSPQDYSVYPINYLLGIADVIGELRRYVLDKIREGDYDHLNEILDKMEELYTHLFSLDYPKGITKNLRHKTDIARNLIEKTRGDISMAIQVNRLNENLKKE